MIEKFGMGMNNYLSYHKELCDRARSLSKSKNADYSDPDAHLDDPMRVFRNFMLVEKLGVCSVEQGFLVRLCDKFSRLCNLLRKGHKRQVLDESKEDTILDIINYVILLASYLKAVKDETKTPGDKIKWPRK